MYTKPYVIAGGIVRNRAWILPRHLHSVANNTPQRMFYLTGDNTDKTEGVLSMLVGWRAEPVEYTVHNTGKPGYTRDGSDGPRYNSRHMGAERNLWMQLALDKFPEATHLWVVDSDVLPEDYVLEKLLKLSVPVAAANVPIADGITPTAMTGWSGRDNRPNRSGDESLLRMPHVATMVGSCYLVEATLFKKYGDRLNFKTREMESAYAPAWGEDPQGEDGYFARYVRSNTLAPMLHHPLARCQHIMTRDI